jgi:hypothetical protein
LTAIYLHNVALARLARACANQPEGLDFQAKARKKEKERNERQAADLVRPPKKLSKR